MGLFELSANKFVNRLKLCGSCPLAKRKKPIPPQGNPKSEILAVTDYVEPSGKWLDIDELEDACIVGVVSCRTSKLSRADITKAANTCLCTVLDMLDKGNFKKVILFGNFVVKLFIDYLWKSSGARMGYDRFIGYQIPIKKWKCHLFPIWHPREILEEKNPNHQVLLQSKFNILLKDILSSEPKSRPLNISEDQIVWIQDAEQLAKVVKRMSKHTTFSAFDYETNCLKPDRKGSKIICVSFTDNDEKVYIFPMLDEFVEPWKAYLQTDFQKIAANMKFETRWSVAKFGVTPRFWWDTMLWSHIENSEGGTKGLKFQSFVQFGKSDYNSQVEPYMTPDKDGLNRLERMDRFELMKYCALDSLLEAKLYQLQVSRYNEAKIRPA